MVSCALKVGVSVSVSGSSGAILKPKTCQQFPTSHQFHDPKSIEFAGLSSQFSEESLVVPDQKILDPWNPRSPVTAPFQAQASFCPSKAIRWWEKTLQPNVVEINSAPELVDTLKNAGDNLVVVHFYSPGCGGCKSLHPKICLLAESNPDAIFLKINQEKLKPMCQALNIHVLPFFRFYKGAKGKVCSFSCTVSTINKFKTALAKHSSERCIPGPAKGLDESELLRLASIGELLLPSPLSMKEEKFDKFVLEKLEIPNSLKRTGNTLEAREEDDAMLISTQ